ncbi:hypothetical protein HAZT_HAZT002505 [Hyalella azteca]|uniref:Aspartate dehydrogenase domain-containing protein n=1 Tax=Hyalella azteca TaxID=294128 RepID=A0A6A0GPY8_HYAAZ|nr:hypothetical protein HAZT_HAZT002505 [Hyalella azteca]
MFLSLQYGEHLLGLAHYLMGSPTALADEQLEQRLRAKANAGSYGLYLPAGALWGGTDIRKMADLGTLESLKITMKKHPSSFKLVGDLQKTCASVRAEAVTLYEGRVRELCAVAPNNVNTMAAAAVAAHNLGFDGVQAKLVADPQLSSWHVVEVEVGGPGGFQVTTERKNPAAVGAVTGNVTYSAFVSSVLAAGLQGNGVHLC